MRLVLILLLLNTFLSVGQGEIPAPPNVELPEFVFPEFSVPNTFIFYQCPAGFPGGVIELKRHFQKPEYEFNWLGEETSKRGYVSFIVEADGSLMDIEVVRGINPELDDLMLRMIEEMPKWIPACDLDGPVRSRVHLPITFILTE